MDAIQYFSGAFSLGSGKKCAVFQSNKNTPGIGAYEVNEQQIRPKTQNSKFNKAKRDLDITVRQRAPSVGQYEQTFKTERAPAYTIVERHKVHSSESEVGPATYNPMENKLQRQPAFSFSYRNDPSNSNATPGPATYFKVQVKNNKKMPEKSFTSAERSIIYNSNAKHPGPGAYQPNLSSHLQRGRDSYTIGFAGKDKVMGQELSPGAGQYELIQKKTQMKGLIFGSKQTNEVEIPTPGPGAYHTREIKSVCSARMGKSIKIGLLSKDIINNPGPGFYETARSIITNKSHQRSSSETFDRSLRSASRQRGLTPGPAAYIENYTSLDGSKYTINFKRKDKATDYVVPGPGEYQILSSTIQSHCITQNGFSLGMRSNFSSQGCTTTKVGPGQYFKHLSYSMGTSFGRAKRWDQNIKSIPGYYNIRGNIGHLPNYMNKTYQQDQGDVDVIEEQL